MSFQSFESIVGCFRIEYNNLLNFIMLNSIIIALYINMQFIFGHFCQFIMDRTIKYCQYPTSFMQGVLHSI